MFEEPTKSQEVQAAIPEPKHSDEKDLKIRALERIKLYPKVPPEPSSYGKYSNYSRPWILQDGRESLLKGSEMRNSYQTPKTYKKSIGIRRKLITDFFWQEMLDEIMDEFASSTTSPGEEYCTEYDANYVKEQFEPFNPEVTLDKTLKVQYTSVKINRGIHSWAENRDSAIQKIVAKSTAPSSWMHLKYPLYGTGSSAITFYSETITKTGPYEILEKFRRCQYFTRPMEDRLDKGWVL